MKTLLRCTLFSVIAAGLINPASSATQEELLQQVVAARGAIFEAFRDNEERLRNLTPEERLQQRAAWETENREAIAALQEDTRQLALAAPPAELPFADKVHLPKGATQELESYLARNDRGQR